jgi:hypothetical protein
VLLDVFRFLCRRVLALTMELTCYRIHRLLTIASVRRYRLPLHVLQMVRTTPLLKLDEDILDVRTVYGHWTDDEYAEAQRQQQAKINTNVDQHKVFLMTYGSFLL